MYQAMKLLNVHDICMTTSKHFLQMALLNSNFQTPLSLSTYVDMYPKSFSFAHSILERDLFSKPKTNDAFLNYGIIIIANNLLQHLHATKHFDNRTEWK